MFEKALKGSRKYWLWLGFLGTLILIGFLAFLAQLQYGLGITGMSRDVSWGFYVAQFTFLVGVAASGVMVVLPYYLHNHKVFGPLTIFGEFLAIAAVIMCLLFIIVDIGQTPRLFNVLLHPTPNSMLFYDMIVLNGYLALNVICGWAALHGEYKGTKYPNWVKPFIYLSIPWAFSIHTVTAFLYAGLPGRHFWLTAVMAPRFLASAFCSGPALLLLALLIVKKVSKFDPGQKAIDTLSKIITYALLANIFLFACELFTAFYSNIPGHMYPIIYLFKGLHGHNEWVIFMWTAWLFMLIAAILLVIPHTRKNINTLAFACVILFIGAWIDKGIGLLTGGFTPTPFETITPYRPTIPELLISIGIWATGFLIMTVLFKIAITVKEARA
ncbi:sulfate reduction electron transfer complex DsrMKJOP subunit DsrP [Thermosulfurimonas dismutans]|uniref:Sulfite reduction-associated complex DsrMKJOP protein DsrP n=1 Tax=Thermosulfurimonas dismutans TaxID=999894 RepID=A0A179D793_9BACT|nr:NrfD/PsrC family molybdoenzyme membrane anchor subunit [Thermosulfurimonas dismutans]OAQ21322.1 Sulfite reduction-associated complex DsrMKJOP protein DsrP [Thermosulfurimonas dismutans]